MSEWNNWQRKKAIDLLQKDHGGEPIFSDDKLIHSMPDKAGKFKETGKGSLYFYKDKMEFKDQSGKLTIYEIDNITGITVQLHERLEFYCNSELHRFHSRKKFFSARKVNDFYDLRISL